jgi:cell division protein FtsB
MLKELKRIIISKATLSILVLLIIAVFVLVCIHGYYGSASQSLNVDSYSSFDELRTRISSLNDEIVELNKEKFSHSERIDDIK